MRSFLALLPDLQLALGIDAWASRQFPSLIRKTSVQNLHITVCFLGDINAKQRCFMEDNLSQTTMEPFNLELDKIGYFPESGALWLGCKSTPASFSVLVKTCRQLANRTSIRVDKKDAEPHVTLARRIETPISAPLVAPSFQFAVDELALIESRLTPHGPQYETVMAWHLDGRYSYDNG